MKKKLGLLFLSFGLVALAGCSGGSKEDLNVLRSDTPSQELIDKYKIADLTNDNKKVVFSDEKSQYTVYAATNTVYLLKKMMLLHILRIILIR